MKEAGINCNRQGSLLTAFFTDNAVTDYDSAKTADKEKYAAFYTHLLENGIFAAPSQFEAMFVSAAHSDEDIAYTCDIVKKFR
jgi:glutamate-1-semialdehyde 2,1-aminomutase